MRSALTAAVLVVLGAAGGAKPVRMGSCTMTNRRTPA